MARYYHGDPPSAGRLGLLPAAFNPPTVAHVELARQAAAMHQLNQVALVLPETMPHKDTLEASLDDRLAMLDAVAEQEPLLAVAVAARGLVYEIVREFRLVIPEEVEIAVLCGADAASRFAAWDYGNGPSFRDQLGDFELIVGARGGPFRAPAGSGDRIHHLELPAELAEVSATQVRDAIARGGPWEHWTLPQVANYIRQRRLYGEH